MFGSLSQCASGADTKSLPSPKHLMKEDYVHQKLEQYRQLFASIADEELQLTADGYEDYSEGYWSDNWEWEYDDPDHVCDQITEAAEFFQECVEDGWYREGVALADLLWNIELEVDNEWDLFEMGLKELVSEDLVSANPHEIAVLTLYAIYQATPPAKRPEALFEHFHLPTFKDISMDEVFLAGREPLPDMREFWQSWFQYLLAQSGDQAARLLEESLAWQNRDSQAEVARKYASTHPSLYLHLISALNQEKDYEEALSMGKEALSLVPVQLRIRSQIALETAQAVMMLGKRSYGEECWFEAFRSDSTAVNYLRLLEANESGENFLQQAAEHWRSFKKSEKAYGEMIPQELREHILTSDEKKFLELLDGKFAATINWCAKDKEGVDWSGSFIKDAVSIFLLLLYQEDTPQIALDGFLGELCSSTHFKAEDYFKGMGVQKAGETPQSDSAVLWQCLLTWKKLHPVSSKEQQAFLSIIENLTDLRVRHIVSHQFRGAYGRAAMLAAALGEVKESLGAVDGKQQTLMKYHSEFPRHTAFGSELKRWGMRKK